MVNNPSSTKQPLTSSTGLVVLGGDDSTASYVHGALGLGPDTRAPEYPHRRGRAVGDERDDRPLRVRLRRGRGALRVLARRCGLRGLRHARGRRRARARRPPLRRARDRLGGQRRRDARGGVVDHAGGARATAPAGTTARGRRRRAARRAAAAHRARAPAPRPPRAHARRGELPRHMPRRRARARPGRRTAARGAPDAAGRTVVVVLRLDRARLRAARRLLARGRAVRAEITVAATDSAGRRLRRCAASCGSCADGQWQRPEPASLNVEPGTGTKRNP